MSVVIHCMDMPESCDVCDFAVTNDDLEVSDYRHVYCGFPGIGEYVTDCIASRHPECPLSEYGKSVCRFPDGVTIKPDGEHEMSPCCDFYEAEVYKNATVMLLRCKRCGNESVGWLRQDNTEEVKGSVQKYEKDQRTRNDLRPRRNDP